jgi:hypothetical protein
VVMASDRGIEKALFEKWRVRSGARFLKGTR